MAQNLLILAGTTEATALARAVAARGIPATLSYAGRVERLPPQSLPHRVGGFGGAEGLARYLSDAAISHVIDATHPFAVQMSRNAVSACASTGVPLIALTRPAWREEQGDRWHRVPDIAAAVAALDRPRLQVMLAVGRMHLQEFAANPQHRYLLRLVDPPGGALPLPDVQVVVDRGPFRSEADRRLMLVHGIQMVVSKNSGGSGAYAKIEAAQSLGLPVLMIDRPVQPSRHEVFDVAAVLDWLGHSGTDRGV
ncbi:cobalt-precorrin-6A reductase [uncultured Paracoccus sp.]|uniref:cobalt-precorrin-6A reductase n=1 Tax=uncultured Paracoccus sp. TaxID=189685 RepID=UPI0026189298|nr:cobalt-precorrin-6A reductase [uncultured Paracoccus sp.]